MTIRDSSPIVDRAYLTGSQYRTDANLAARQAVYACQVPRIDLPRAVFDVAVAPHMRLGVDGTFRVRTQSGVLICR